MLLIRGSVGPEVKTLQENLNTIGVTVDVDGVYGGHTEQAVKTFQTANGIPSDGKYGPQSHEKMQECLAQAQAGSAGSGQAQS